MRIEYCVLYQRKKLMLIEIALYSSLKTYNQFYNILRLFDVLPNFPFTTSETVGDYYL